MDDSDELKFLEANVEQYEAAQAAKAVAKFLAAFFLRWFLKFGGYSDGTIDIDHRTVKTVSTPPSIIVRVALTLPPH